MLSFPLHLSQEGFIRENNCAPVGWCPLIYFQQSFSPTCPKGFSLLRQWQHDPATSSSGGEGLDLLRCPEGASLQLQVLDDPEHFLSAAMFCATFFLHMRKL
ncbi:hypothetical protein XENORESO_020516 [Xenotaenia resolanae]|uniref:Uncharacterized protein n=1 Tax=Xenotaenia resolanae TaxID=208358 RepID=A0ABV0WIR9_9TELE